MLQGVRLITDLDTQLEPEELRGTGRRRASRVKRALEKLSLEYGLTCRLTALVAVVEREGDMSGEVPRTTIVPVGMPQGVLFGSYFGAQPGPACCEAPRAQRSGTPRDALLLDSVGTPRPQARMVERRVMPERKARRGKEDDLLELEGMIEPDGGMPGDTDEGCVMAAVMTVLLFASEDHGPLCGAFAPHLKRLLSYLKTSDMSAFNAKQRSAIAGVLEAVGEGRPIAGEWLAQARSYLKNAKVPPRRFWQEVRKVQTSGEGA